jgi:hypothetical protein
VTTQIGYRGIHKTGQLEIKLNLGNKGISQNGPLDVQRAARKTFTHEGPCTYYVVLIGSVDWYQFCYDGSYEEKASNLYYTYIGDIVSFTIYQPTVQYINLEIFFSHTISPITCSLTTVNHSPNS